MPNPSNSTMQHVRGQDAATGPARRTQFVLAAFCIAMTGAFAMLALDAPNPVRGFPLTSITPDRPATADDLLFQLDVPLDTARWDGIVIHHLADPFGTPESIHRQHLSWGYQGLGYHFIIGNGNGLGDGEIHVGYRWAGQLPGAHVVGDAGRDHNERSIGICLVGNGDNHVFSDRQIRHLIRLVQRLQQALGIGRDQVVLHREISETVSSPGTYFPIAQFQAELLDLPH
jgi:hypothetical protein